MFHVRVTGATIQPKNEAIAVRDSKARPSSSVGGDALDDEVPARMVDANWLSHS